MPVPDVNLQFCALAHSYELAMSSNDPAIVTVARGIAVVGLGLTSGYILSLVSR